MTTKYSEWFRVFYSTVNIRYGYRFDVTDHTQMNQAREFYDKDHSPTGAAFLYVNTYRLI